jgi:predicted dehydrogenase
VFKDPEIKGVIIATPVASHFDLAINALEAGKHILVEKPLSRPWSSRANRQARESKNLVAMVGHVSF